MRLTFYGLLYTASFSLPDDDSLADNVLTIFDRKRFKDLYPELYEQVKTFDLNSPGVGTKDIDNVRKWDNFLYRINNIRSSDAITKKITGFINTGKIPRGYIYDSSKDILDREDMLIYLIYALVLNKNYDFELQSPDNNYKVLLSAWWNNSQIYNKIKLKMSDLVYRRMVVAETVLHKIENIKTILAAQSAACNLRLPKHKKSQNNSIKDYIFKRAGN